MRIRTAVAATLLALAALALGAQTAAADDLGDVLGNLTEIIDHGLFDN